MGPWRRASARPPRLLLPSRGKGSRTNIPAPAAGNWLGDALVDLGDWLRGAPEEFSFLLDGRVAHRMAPRLKMGKPPGKRPQYCAVVVSSRHPCKIPGRPPSPQKAVPISASGLLGYTPLVDGTM